MLLQKFTMNLSGDGIRIETLEGREMLVVPCVMLTEGVHTGSSGPLYYPAEELEKAPAVWNAKPVVVYHPEKDGAGVSACDAEILNSRKVGVMMNTRWDADAKKLRTEVWLDKLRMNEVDGRIAEFLDKKQIMEVSTGVFTDNEEVKGEFNGELYDGIARNYRPDHLALLPDKVGACSVAKGAGLLQLNEASPTVVKEVVERAVKQAMVAAGLTANDLSNNTVSQALYRIMAEKLGTKPTDPACRCYWDGWIEDVFKSWFVYRHGDKYFRLNYSQTDDKVSVSGTAVEVLCVTEYRSVEGFLVGNSADDDNTPANMKGKKKMKTKAEMVTHLLANGGFEESDRPTLEGYSEAKLGKLCEKIDGAPAAPPAPPAPTGNSEQQKDDAKKAQSVDEYVANAPPEMQGVLKSGLASYTAEKNRLVGVIVANKRNKFTQDQLQKKDLDELTSLAALAETPAVPVTTSPTFDPPSYAGQTAGVVGPTGNAEKKSEPLMAPSMEFKTAS